jgi:hypothetical protein
MSAIDTNGLYAANTALRDGRLAHIHPCVAQQLTLVEQVENCLQIIGVRTAK